MTKKGTTNGFRGFEQRKKERLTFSGPKEIEKVNLTFLPVINKEIRCLWCIWMVNCKKIGIVDPIFKAKSQKLVKRTYLQRSKQQTRYR